MTSFPVNFFTTVCVCAYVCECSNMNICIVFKFGWNVQRQLCTGGTINIINMIIIVQNGQWYLIATTRLNKWPKIFSESYDLQLPSWDRIDWFFLNGWWKERASRSIALWLTLVFKTHKSLIFHSASVHPACLCVLT